MKRTHALPIRFRDIFSFAWGYLKEYPGMLFLAVIGLFGGASMELLRPVIAGELVDFLADHASSPREAFSGAFVYVGYYMLVGIIFWTFRHSSWFFWARLVAQGMRQLTEDTLFKVQRLSTDWHESSFAGATVTKVKRGMRGLQAFIDLFYYQFIPLTLVMVGMVIIVSVKYLWLGLVIGLGMVLYAIVSIMLALRYVMPARTEENRHDTRTGARLADTISCNATVKSFAKEASEDNLFHKVARDFEKASIKSWFRGEYTNMVQNIMMTLFKFVFIGFAVWLWAIETFTIGDFVFVLTSYSIISAHLRQIGNEIRRMQMAASDMEDVVAFSKQPFIVADKPDAKSLMIRQGKIVFDTVTFQYGSTLQPVFEDFSISIQPGEKVALVGHSGGGKTTFVKLLQRLYDTQKGSILIDGQNIVDVTLESLRDNVVLVPQDPILFHRSLADNIAYGKPEASRQEIIQASRLAHAHEFISRSAQGYDTFVGERGVKLSGGERQRVAIARAILDDRRILIFDEATSSLDSLSEKYIQDSIEKLMQGRTTIMIAHRLSTIKKADRILVFEDGKIAEEGSHATLVRKKGGVYRQLYEMQAGGFIE